MKRLLILLAFISFSLNAQEVKTVMIKSVETYGSFASMKKVLHIIEERNEVQTIDLMKHNTNGIPQNMAVIKGKIDEYLNEGFELISSTANSFGWNGVFTIEHTYILSSKETR